MSTKPPVRLVWILTHPMSANILLRGQLRYFQEHGFEVTVICSPGAELDQVAEREGVRISPVWIPVRANLVNDVKTFLRLAWVLVRIRPTVVLAGTPPAARIGLLTARLLNIPVRIYSLRGLPLESVPAEMRHLFIDQERRTAACAHRIFCVSESLRQKYLEYGLDRDGKTRVIGGGSGNGVDTNRFRPAIDNESIELRRSLSIPDDAVVIGWVGRLTPNKGVSDLADVFFGTVLGNWPQAYLLLVGGPCPFNPVSEELIQRFRNCAKVRMTGHTQDAAPFYRAMNIFIFPSYREGLPNAPLEASASGLAVVGYAATGTVDAVAHGETGMLVPVGDAKALAKSTVRYLQSKKLADRHGVQGRQRCLRLFQQKRLWELLRREVLDLVEQ